MKNIIHLDSPSANPDAARQLSRLISPSGAGVTSCHPGSGIEIEFESNETAHEALRAGIERYLDKYSGTARTIIEKEIIIQDDNFVIGVVTGYMTSGIPTMPIIRHF